MKGYYLISICLMLVNTLDVFGQGSRQNVQDWKKLQYDQVKLYFYCPLKPYEEIEVEGKLNQFVDHRNARVIKQDEVDEIFKRVIKKKGEETEPASCFLPHHGIVFYKQKKIVASISFCLMCNVMKSRPALGNLNYGFPYLEKLVKKYRLPNFDQPNKYRMDCEKLKRNN